MTVSLSRCRLGTRRPCIALQLGVTRDKTAQPLAATACLIPPCIIAAVLSSSTYRPSKNCFCNYERRHKVSATCRGSNHMGHPRVLRDPLNWPQPTNARQANANPSGQLRLTRSWQLAELPACTIAQHDATSQTRRQRSRENTTIRARTREECSKHAYCNHNHGRRRRWSANLAAHPSTTF